MMVSRRDRNFDGLERGVVGWMVRERSEISRCQKTNNNTLAITHGKSLFLLLLLLWSWPQGEAWPHGHGEAVAGLLCNPPCVTSSFSTPVGICAELGFL